MERFKLTISYDGTNYAGWQIQPNGMTIQQKIQDALRGLDGSEPKVHGSGRTDQGVHARRQVAHVDLQRDWGRGSLQSALNGVLPRDIRIQDCCRVAGTFHARRSAVSKEYRYFIYNGPVLPPDKRLYRAHARARLDVPAMHKAAAYLVGRHDFAAFTANPRRIVESTVRSVTKLTVTRRGTEITIIARGEGFLYKMVRSLAGFLIRVGEGNEAPSHARTVLHSRERTARVPTAQPQGLFLWTVDY